jgi:probable rRNA maturation factor
MKILIRKQRGKQKINKKTVRKIGRAILSALGYPDAELSISLVNDRSIAQLNETYLKRSRPTDVLAFAMGEGDFSMVNPHLLGDVVISSERALSQAASKYHSFEEELCLLLIHGILHLVGYDHETPGYQARRMRKKENELFRLMSKQFLSPASP